MTIFGINGASKEEGFCKISFEFNPLSMVECVGVLIAESAVGQLIS